MSGSDDIYDFDVVAEDRVRIGKLADVILYTQGQIRGHLIAEVFIEGEIAESRKIDVQITHSLGPDALILKPESASIV
jgi:hypothetical protein